MDVETYIGVVSEGQIRLLTAQTLPEGCRVYVVVPKSNHELLDAHLARRKANRWLLEHVGNLVMADQPQFTQVDQQAIWRFGAFLTAQGRQPLGPIGEVDVDARTGSVITNRDKIGEMITRGEALAHTTYPTKN